MNRRHMLIAIGGTVLLPGWLTRTRAAATGDGPRLLLSDAQWRDRLTPEQYEILRNEGTEAPWSSELLKEKRSGRYLCAGCRQPLFTSATKYDSGTGWPSFFDVLPGAVATRTDYKLIWPRTEYHCAHCGGHHGHVFKDGPKPTGLRYCNNGAALTFEADSA